MTARCAYGQSSRLIVRHAAKSEVSMTVLDCPGESRAEEAGELVGLAGCPLHASRWRWPDDTQPSSERGVCHIARGALRPYSSPRTRTAIEAKGTAMRKLIGVLILVISTSASARWTWTETDGGFVVRNGSIDEPSTVVIQVKSKRAAKTLSKKLNEIDKDDKEGFWDDGSGHCDGPTIHC